MLRLREDLTLLPGVIDPQVHFREPRLEHKEELFTATCACAIGGVTCFLEIPNTHPPTSVGSHPGTSTNDMVCL